MTCFFRWRLRYEAFSESASALIVARHLRLYGEKEEGFRLARKRDEKGVDPVRLTNVVPMVRLVY